MQQGGITPAPFSWCVNLQVTWLAVTEVRSTSFGLVLHAQHIFANSLTFLINWESPDSLLQHCIMLWLVFHHRVWYRALSLRYACIRSSGIILTTRATFVPNFVSFSGLHCWMEKNRVLNQSITHPANLMPGERKLVLGTRSGQIPGAQPEQGVYGYGGEYLLHKSSYSTVTVPWFSSCILVHSSQKLYKHKHYFDEAGGWSSVFLLLVRTQLCLLCGFGKKYYFKTTGNSVCPWIQFRPITIHAPLDT